MKGSTLTDVHDLRNYDELTYSLPPREAVIAAYAQSKGDWNTWDYEKKYAHLVRFSGTNDRTVSCGDFAAVMAEGTGFEPV